MKDVSVDYHDDRETGIGYYTVVSVNTYKGVVFLKTLQDAMRHGGKVGRVTYDGLESKKQVVDYPNVYQATSFGLSAKDMGVTIEHLRILED